jgi:hypothetical protein
VYSHKSSVDKHDRKTRVLRHKISSKNKILRLEKLECELDGTGSVWSPIGWYWFSVVSNLMVLA